jgi:Phytoene dehydrogenase and related proteins
MKCDTVVVGGGMAGLSTAAFLAAAESSVVVLEKHDKPGGYTASFERRGVSFDLGIEGLRELAPDSWLAPFLRWWGVELDLEPREETIAVSTARGRYRLRGSALGEDLRSAFPGSARRIDRFLDLNAAIVREMSSGPAPKPPYEGSRSTWPAMSRSGRPSRRRFPRSPWPRSPSAPESCSESGRRPVAGPAPWPWL